MNGLTQSLKVATEKHGPPTVSHVMRQTGKSFLSLVFGDDETYFMLASDKYTIYEMHKHDTKVTPHSWRDLGTRTAMLDAMATIAGQFAGRKPAPKADRDTLRRYERRFSSAARWAGALVQAQRYSAYAQLYRDYDGYRSLQGAGMAI